MEKALNVLEDCFHEKILLYQELVENLRKERALLVDTDMDGLWDISDRKQEIVSRIEEVQSRILNVFSDLTGQDHLGKSQYRIESLLLMVPNGRRRRFRQAHLSIVQLKSETRQMSLENKALVEQSLDFLDELISLIADNGTKGRGYNNGGVFDQNGPANLLISREV